MRCSSLVPAVFALSLVPGVTRVAAQPRPSDQPQAASAPRFYATLGLAGYAVAIDPFSGSSAAPAVGLGVFLTPRLTIEGEVLRPVAPVRHDYSGWSISLAGPGATREEIERMAVRTRFYNRLSIPWAGSIAVGFNANLSRRASARALVGLAFRHATRTRDDVNVQAPPGHTLVEFPDQHYRSEEIVAGPLLGLAVPVRLVDSLAVVPQIRVEVAPRGDAVDRVVRPMLGLEWRF